MTITNKKFNINVTTYTLGLLQGFITQDEFELLCLIPNSESKVTKQIRYLLDNIIELNKINTMKTLTKNQLQIITLNNKTYIPFKLHQLPSYFNEIPMSETFNLKGYTYVNLNELKSFNKNITTFNNKLEGQYSSSK